jgi:predicted acetyltransferase
VDLELRSVTEEEFAAWSRGIERAFGFHGDDKHIESWRAITELDRTLAAITDGEFVGSAGAFSFEMALPGGATLPAAGVTAVSVRSTHRRRGVLRQMMERQLADVAERGEPFAVLTASESIIYGRFGYGLATQSWGWTMKTEGTVLARPSTATGRVRLIEKDEAQKVLPGVRARAWRRHPGEFDWVQPRWDSFFNDPEHERDGMSPLWFAVHESTGGNADGFIVWRTKPGWDGGLPNMEVRVVELYGDDDEIETALFEHVMSIDLVRTVSSWDRPVEDPLRWRLADSRRMQGKRVGDHLWLRVRDVERALSARQLGADDRIVIEVVDDVRPSTGGRFAVEPGSCRRTDADAEVSMHIRDLGAIYLGGVSATTLARANRITGDADALRRADRLFASSQTPWCATHF